MDIVNMFSSFFAAEMIDISDDMVSASENYLKDKIQYDMELSDTAFKTIFDHVEKRFNQIAKNQFGISDNYKVSLTNAWLNKNDATNITTPHAHPTKFLSGVLYLKASPETSALNFMTPVPIVGEKIPQTAVDNYISKWTEYNSCSFGIPSQRGMLVLFPSWLYHYVTTNGAVDRISLAFNGAIIKNE